MVSHDPNCSRMTSLSQLARLAPDQLLPGDIVAETIRGPDHGD
jgi:hypothetical protein